MMRPAQRLTGVRAYRAPVRVSRNSAAGGSCAPGHARGGPRAERAAAVQSQAFASLAEALGPAGADEGPAVGRGCGGNLGKAAAQVGGELAIPYAGYKVNAMKVLERMQRHRIGKIVCVLTLLGLANSAGAAQVARVPVKVSINWRRTIIVSRSTPTFQVVVNPLLRSGSPIYKSAFKAIKDMGANYVRFVPWLPYPKLAVAELKPPTATHTYWNFSRIDPVMRRFMKATSGHSTIINFSTIPEWMFKTKRPVPYPKDPNQVDWHYERGTRLRDPSCRQLANYYARLVSWFTRGGFRDEHGKWHSSGYHYRFPYWEVLNEVDAEHHTTPEQYTRRYDAIVGAIHKISPRTKFVGLALALPEDGVRYFEYFLNHKNHRPGIPLNFISFHFYASPALSEGPNDWQYTFFDQAKGFLATTRYIIAIRNRLSPETKIDTDELGVILPTDALGIRARRALHYRIPRIYWNAAAALYAYLFVHLSRLGVNVIGESQLVGFPSQFPSVTMINWRNGKPNARYWVLKMILDNFHRGSRLVSTHVSAGRSVASQAFVTTTGRKLLLINKRNRVVAVRLPKAFRAAKEWIVDESTGEGPAHVLEHLGAVVRLPPFAVAVIAR